MIEERLAAGARVDSAGPASSGSSGPAISETSPNEVLELLRDISAVAGRDGTLKKKLQDVQITLGAVVRKLYLEGIELEHPFDLTAERFKILSQNSEDGLALAILRRAGLGNGRFVEIGCGTNGGNSGFFAEELGWSGLMVDAVGDRVAAVRQRFNPERVRAVQAWVKRETINELLVHGGMTGEIDLLSIDIDGNDYWVWEALDVASPRLAILEYNAIFGDERAVVVPYDPQFDRHTLKSTYFGASLAALTHLARRKDYRLVAVEPRGVNAFFLRNDVSPSIPAVQPGRAYRPKVTMDDDKRVKVGDRSARLYAYIRENDLPLVELE